MKLFSKLGGIKSMQNDEAACKEIKYFSLRSVQLIAVEQLTKSCYKVGMLIKTVCALSFFYCGITEIF